jgi:23S rRNA pseudouridine1911/1915/1917 synthase
MSSQRWTAGDGDPPRLAAFVRARTRRPWGEVKRWIETGKLAVDGVATLDAGASVRPGAVVVLEPSAPRPRDPGREVRIAFEDPQLVVVDKPAGVSSVPYETRERGTAMDLVRDAWRRMGRRATATPLHVVHRIDRATSGLLAFAKTKRAERALGRQFRAHAIERTYLCVAHGALSDARIESFLVPDRGDGLRGSARQPGQGKRAVTHVRVRERLRGATLCEVRLETGKTHQIRIHLAERGHPLVGETVYIRDLERDGRAPIPCPRLLLHAATLGFAHPVTGEALRFESPLPPDFEAALAQLR